MPARFLLLLLLLLFGEAASAGVALGPLVPSSVVAKVANVKRWRRRQFKQQRVNEQIIDRLRMRSAQRDVRPLWLLCGRGLQCKWAPVDSGSK